MTPSDYPGLALHEQGIALQTQGQMAAALAAYDGALALSPDMAIIHYSRGGALMEMGRIEDAIAGYDAALALDPNLAIAHYNRGVALTRLQRLTEALAGFDRALAIAPTLANAWNNRSGVLQALGRSDEALESIERVVKLRPRDDAAFYNGGILLLSLMRYEEAQKAFEHALALNPRHPDALGCLVAAALRACNWPKLAQLKPQLESVIREGKSVVPPLTLLALSDDAALQRLCAEINLRRTLDDTPLGRDTPPPLWNGERYDHDRIRIGYMSTDLRSHPVGVQIVDVLERHDRKRFEVIGLFLGHDDGSALHRRIVKACDRFHSIAEVSDQGAAALIRELEVDILIDLNGQTYGWRPGIMKYRPAPVNAQYLGYAGTTGADFIDYVIGDAHVAPFEDAPAFSESIVQLPGSFWPNDPSREVAPPPPRAELGLPEDAFVFCCFNSPHKISAEIFRSWLRLLQALPGSVLWLRAGSEGIQRNLRREAAFGGIDPKRLIFAPRTESLAAHLGRQRRADLFLDCFPYGAHVTASDALWAGLPVVTRRGQSFASRVAASFLHALGLEELIADGAKEYEALALALARDPARLAALRARLEVALDARPLFDAPRFMGGLEAAYAEMRARAERGEAPVPFEAPVAPSS